MIERIQRGEIEEGSSVMVTNAVVVSRGGLKGSSCPMAKNRQRHLCVPPQCYKPRH